MPGGVSSQALSDKAWSAIVGGTKMAWKIGLLAGLAMVATAHAQTKDDFRRDWLKSQFSGWGGIVFYCDISENAGPTVKKLCDWASQRVRILARQSGAPLTVLSSERYERYAQRFARKDRPIDLQLAILGNKETPGSAAAVHIAIRATSSGDLPPDERSTGPKPRSGTLVMWETEAIVSGVPGTEMDGALQQAAESHLMKFLNDYADGQQ